MSGRNQKKLAVLNWAGHGNFGDELFNDAYRQLFPDWKIHFFTDEKGKAIPKIDFDIVNQCDLFALGGGELVQRGQLFMPPYWTNKIKPQIPKIILGCGINANRYSELKQEVICELENFRYIGLRDYISVQLLQEHPLLRKNAALFHDLAFSANYGSVKSLEPTERTLVVIPTDRTSNKFDNGVIETNFTKKIAKELDKVSWMYPHIIFLSFGSEDNDDYKTCQELTKQFSNAKVIVNFSVNRQLFFRSYRWRFLYLHLSVAWYNTC